MGIRNCKQEMKIKWLERENRGICSSEDKISGLNYSKSYLDAKDEIIAFAKMLFRFIPVSPHFIILIFINTFKISHFF